MSQQDPKRGAGEAAEPKEGSEAEALPELDEEMRAALAEAGMDEAADAGNEGDPAHTAEEPKGGAVLDEVDVRELLRSALAPPPGAVAPDLLRGVQRKLRHRSRGKFYGDGWSTARSPRSTYLITSLVMLVLIALVFFTLVPWGGGALP
ncbi:MAG: hypothetical protein ABI193_19455 [Minicystis sp.]